MSGRDALFSGAASRVIVILICASMSGCSTAERELKKLDKLCTVSDPVEIYDQTLWDRYIRQIRAEFVELGHTEPDQPLIALQRDGYRHEYLPNTNPIDGRVYYAPKVLFHETRKSPN